MSETELTIARETAAMLDERLKLLDAEMAAFLHLDGPTRAVTSEHWFRDEIRKALEPMIARIVALEKKPLPAPTAAATTVKPPKEFITAIGQLVHDEIKPLRERLMLLEKKIEKLEQRKYVGVWATGKYHEGNMVTLDGSVFHCNVAETTQRPGTGPDWTLAIKRGQDGRDGDSARRPSHR